MKDVAAIKVTRTFRETVTVVINHSSCGLAHMAADSMLGHRTSDHRRALVEPASQSRRAARPPAARDPRAPPERRDARHGEPALRPFGARPGLRCCAAESF